MQTPRLKGKEITVFYQDPKIQTLDALIGRRLFLKDNFGMGLEKLNEEDIKLAKKTKSKSDKSVKPPRPKAKGYSY